MVKIIKLLKILTSNSGDKSLEILYVTQGYSDQCAVISWVILGT